MKTTFLAILVSAAYLVSAQSVNNNGLNGLKAGNSVIVTKPHQGATLDIGQNQTIAWKAVKEGVDTLLINLVKGDPKALVLVQTLASQVNATAGTVQVQIPQNITEGNDYALAIGADLEHLSYIRHIKLKNVKAKHTKKEKTTKAKHTKKEKTTKVKPTKKEKTTKVKPTKKEKTTKVKPTKKEKSTKIKPVHTGRPTNIPSGRPSGVPVGPGNNNGKGPSGVPVGPGNNNGKGPKGGFQKRDETATSGSSRNLVAGAMIAVPAAIAAMVGF